jgi:hypothetical protein
LIEIHIDPSKVESAYDISEDVEPEFDIVALETTDNSVIGYVDKVLYQNDTYYVLDRDGATVFLFDSTGKFISKLYKKGQGPDEYSKISAFCMVDKNIWISDANLRFLICYDENLKMTERFSTFDIIGVEDIQYIDGNIYMAGNWNVWNKKNVQFAAYSIQNKSVKEFWHVPARDSESALFKKSSQLALSDSSCLFIHSYCDTIFQLKNNEFAPKYRMIFSERYKDTPSSIEEITDPNNSHIIRGIQDIKQTRNKIIIGYYDDVHLVSAIYDKKDEICKVYPYFIDSELNDVNLFQYGIFFDDTNNMISVCETNMFIEAFGKDTDRAKIKNEMVKKKIETIISTFDEYSNPVIIKYKLKQNSKL